MARSTSGLFPEMNLPKTWASLPRSDFQMSWSADSAGKETLDTFNASAAFSRRRCPAPRIEHHTLDRECCNVTADAAGGIGARLALRKAEKMGGPKKGECRPRTGTDRVTKDTVRSRERCQAARTSYLRSPTRWVKGAACRLRRR
jgi:hypothetical protein